MIRSWFSPRVRPRPALYVAPPEYARVFVSRAQIDVSRSYRVAHLSVQSGPLLRGLVSVTASVFFSSHYRGVELEQGMLLMLEFEADCSVDVATELDVQYSVSAPHIAKKNARRAAFNYMTLN